MSQDHVTIDLSGTGDPDVCLVDALARLALALQQRGLELRLENVPDEFQQLVTFMGLAGVLLDRV